MNRSAPPGYDELRIGGIRIVVRSSFTDAVRVAMAGGTLFSFAAHQPGARALAGRGTAWASTLPDGDGIVVRHSRHGGVLAPITRDLFLWPTRAPTELESTLRLARSGVPCPELLAYVVYPAWGMLARADVATRRLEGADLPDAWRSARTASEHAVIMEAVATLLRQLHHAGAWHPDLNLKNVFIVPGANGRQAFVLDVDRVRFGEPRSRHIGRRNLDRLLRSARRWNADWNLGLDPARWLDPLAHDLATDGAA